MSGHNVIGDQLRGSNHNWVASHHPITDCFITVCLIYGIHETVLINKHIVTPQFAPFFSVNQPQVLIDPVHLTHVSYVPVPKTKTIKHQKGRQGNRMKHRQFLWCLWFTPCIISCLQAALKRKYILIKS